MIQVCRNDGVELHLEEFGEPLRPLIILISGAGAPAEFWPRDFCDGLAGKGFRVVRFWHRDTGISTHFDAPYSIDALIGDVLALQAELGAGKAHLVGHSMGGYIVQMMACRYPHRMLGSVAMATGPVHSEDGKQRLELSSPDASLWPKLLANQPKGDFESDLAGWLTSWNLLNGAIEIEENLAVGYTRALYDGPASNHQVADNHIHAVSTVPDSLAHELTECDVPLLFLTGEYDPLVPPDHGRKSAGLSLAGQFRILPQAGHMYFNRATWDHILQEVSHHCAVADRRQEPIRP
ncbi:alpha/beta fold hydrolase [Erythrobacter sp. GH1-10]|uniref:alpha/beta fold hydrolase n=1 Tax=Erythrobacter sp. GH1-10 TaxID=3349334 RepID=UPI00387820EF